MRPLRIGAGTVGALAAATVVIAAVLPAQPAYAATTNFYVDPANGSDSNAGTSTATAFKTSRPPRPRSGPSTRTCPTTSS
jgi:hypothetical protein